LCRLSREISSLDLEEIINVCVTKVPHIVQARYASFYLHDYDSGELRLSRHNHGYRIDEVVPVRADSTSAMVQALLARQILLVTDFDAYEQSHQAKVEHPYAARYASRSCLLVPMMTGNRVVGVLNLADKLNGGCFDELNDLPPMEQLSALVGAAIRNYQLYNEVSLQARTDSMTGFLNHQTFFEELERETLRLARYDGTLSLIMTDVDNFKTFNDLYGHQVGDEILRKTASIIRSNVRETDVPARYGGDEFAIILIQTDLERGRRVAERIRETVELSALKHEDKTLSLTLSIGVAQYRPGMSATEFANEADQALYAAKARGRNCVAAPGLRMAEV
jgi:diguanylate cyclase (GGDEF)-like protein